jgi:hypothetical protein
MMHAELLGGLQVRKWSYIEYKLWMSLLFTRYKITINDDDNW